MTIISLFEPAASGGDACCRAGAAIGGGAEAYGCGEAIGGLIIGGLIEEGREPP